MNRRLQRNADRLKLCKDPNTAPELLEEIASSRALTQAFVNALVRNPATPVGVLLSLGARAPEGLLENPVWPLLILADSSFLERMPFYTQAALARCRACPPDLIRRLAGTNRRPVIVRTTAAGNPATPMDVLQSFLRAAEPVRAELVHNPKLPKAWHGRLAVDRSANVRAGLAARRDVSPHLLTSLSRDRSLSKVRVAVARNPRTPYPALSYLSGSKLTAIQAGLRQNPRWNGPVAPMGYTTCLGVLDR